MLIEFETICVRRGLEELPKVSAILDSHRKVPTVFFNSAAELQDPNGMLAEKRAHGHRLLVIDHNSESLLSRHCWDSRAGMCPLPLKVQCCTKAAVLSLYSFNQKEAVFQACRPFVLGYVVDMRHLARSLRNRHGAGIETATVITGHGFDVLACDGAHYAPRIVEMFGKLRNVKLVVITKAGMRDVQPLLALNHNGHTIMSWSVSCDEVRARYEKNSFPLGERLDAAKAAQDAGYEVRFRVEPLLGFAGWQDAYGRTIDAIYAKGIRPTRFTLGSFRLPGLLRNVARSNFPEWDLLEQPFLYDYGRRKSYPRYIRMRYYRHAIAKIREHDDKTVIALCREMPPIRRRLG